MPTSGPPLRRRSIAALVVALALLILVIAGTALMSLRQSYTQTWVRHTLVVENILGRVLLTLRAAESNERAFLLTGEDVSRTAYLGNVTEATNRLNDLATAISDNPVQVTATASLRNLVEARLQPLDQAVALYRSGKIADAVAMDRDNSPEPMDAVEKLVTTMMDTERGLLIQRAADLSGLTVGVEVGIGAALVLSAILALLVMTEMRRRISSLLEAYKALETANNRLAVEINEREILEARLRQAQKMEALGQLTGGIAHDFNNMLAVIVSCLGLMKRRVDKSDFRIDRYIEGASEAAGKAAALTHRLLAFGRQQPLAPQPLDANQLVSGTGDMLRRTLGDIRLEVALVPDLWRANADPNQLENAIINLAVNGRDAMPNGGTLTIETANAVLDKAYADQHAEVTAGEYVMISVSDTGVGMPPEVEARAFDPFFTTKEVGKGTGLGLSQVFGFVKQSGGHVKIYSEVDVGTSVKMYLPRSDLDARPYSAGGGARPDRSGADRTNVTVLVVEDESRMREVAVDAMRELGYTVLQAENAQAALQIVDAHPEITLLFTDVIMPQTNGRQLAEEATRRRPEIKVLYTTGFSRNAIIHNNILDPGVNFIAKPFTLEQLARKVDEVLSESVTNAG